MSRILIIEDEIAIADLERDYLELSDFEVEVEHDGTAGLELALNEEWDLIARSHASRNGWLRDLPECPFGEECSHYYGICP